MAAHVHAWVTYLGNRGANCSSLVTLPLHGALHPSNITSYVVGYSPPSFRRHKTSWTKHPTEFWSDRAKETRHTKDSSRVVTPADNLGRKKPCETGYQENSRGHSHRLRVPVPRLCELPHVWPRPLGDLQRRPVFVLPTGVSPLEAKSDDLWVSLFPSA